MAVPSSRHPFCIVRRPNPVYTEFNCSSQHHFPKEVGWRKDPEHNVFKQTNQAAWTFCLLFLQQYCILMTDYSFPPKHLASGLNRIDSESTMTLTRIKKVLNLNGWSVSSIQLNYIKWLADFLALKTKGVSLHIPTSINVISYGPVPQPR